MKRIIDGWLYDTEKAEVLYEYKWDDEKSTKLYKTGNGNYFFMTLKMRGSIRRMEMKTWNG